ncbi:MAG: hypothetical protein ACWA5X_11455 [bacterium]
MTSSIAILRKPLFAIPLLLALLSGCAAIPKDDYRSQYLNGHADAALATLDSDAYHSQRNELLRLMEKGSLLHEARDYAASSQELLKASRLMDELDYVSIADQSKSALANDWAARYRGEYAERLWVHSYQMMNFLLLGKPDSAAVEARQALLLMEKYADALDHDLFTHALIAQSFEAVNKPNDAWIEYRKLAKKLPSPAPVAAPLVRLGRQLGFIDEARNYEQYLSSGELANLHKPELILFVATGIIPEKYASSLFVQPDIRISFPAYQRSFNTPPNLKVYTGTPPNKQPLELQDITSDLARVAQESLDARGKALLAKAVARASIKHSLAHDLKKENQAAGELLSAVFWLLEQADTRSWRTLPGYLSLIRTPRPQGVSRVEIHNGSAVRSIDLSNNTERRNSYRSLRFN